MSHRKRAVLLLAVILVALPSQAHQQKEAITRVLFNPRSGNIEVMHRFLLHDAEHAVRVLFGSSANLVDDVADRQRFAAYVHQRFSMLDQDEREIPLQPVGHEIEGQYIWVYAEASMPASLSALTLSHEALRELWPDQVNLVNVERDSITRSALFDGGSQQLTIRF